MAGNDRRGGKPIVFQSTFQKRGSFPSWRNCPDDEGFFREMRFQSVRLRRKEKREEGK
jgi:hypothetical protein